jgi:hypothetical protein
VSDGKALRVVSKRESPLDLVRQRRLSELCRLHQLSAPQYAFVKVRSTVRVLQLCSTKATDSVTGSVTDSMTDKVRE